jgi:hypothetical protein
VDPPVAPWSLAASVDTFAGTDPVVRWPGSIGKDRAW